MSLAVEPMDVDDDDDDDDGCINSSANSASSDGESNHGRSEAPLLPDQTAVQARVKSDLQDFLYPDTPDGTFYFQLRDEVGRRIGTYLQQYGLVEPGRRRSHSSSPLKVFITRSGLERDEEVSIAVPEAVHSDTSSPSEDPFAEFDGDNGDEAASSGGWSSDHAAEELSDKEESELLSEAADPSHWQEQSSPKGTSERIRAVRKPSGYFPVSLPPVRAFSQSKVQELEARLADTARYSQKSHSHQTQDKFSKDGESTQAESHHTSLASSNTTRDNGQDSVVNTTACDSLNLQAAEADEASLDGSAEDSLDSQESNIDVYSPFSGRVAQHRNADLERIATLRKQLKQYAEQTRKDGQLLAQLGKDNSLLIVRNRRLQRTSEQQQKLIAWLQSQTRTVRPKEAQRITGAQGSRVTPSLPKSPIEASRPKFQQVQEEHVRAVRSSSSEDSGAANPGLQSDHHVDKLLQAYRALAHSHNEMRRQCHWLRATMLPTIHPSEREPLRI